MALRKILLEGSQYQELSRTIRDHLQKTAGAGKHGAEKFGDGVACRLISEGIGAGEVGNLLVDLDREFRRVTSVMIERPFPYTPKRAIRPVSTRYGEVRLTSAQSGSFEVYAYAYGEVARILLSDPVQFAITLDWFWNKIPQRWRTGPTTANREAIHDHIPGIVASATEVARSGQPVELVVDVKNDGSYEIRFRSVDGQRWQ